MLHCMNVISAAVADAHIDGNDDYDDDVDDVS